MRRVRWVVAVIALGAGLLAVPGALPEGSGLADVPPAGLGPAGEGVRDGEDGSEARSGGGPGPTDPGGAAGGDAASGSPAGEGAAGGGGAVSAGPALPAGDVLAGLLSAEVPPVGNGETVTVPGSVAAPGPGPARTVRVEVEGGLPVDPAVFAGFVLDGLNDPRGWGHEGAMSFARTDGDAEIVVVLASPETSARLCAPLDTGGTLSCRNGPRAILTHHRWVLAHPDYGDDRTGYRHYVVNHEVGHVLGYGHVPCPGAGVPAPVMMQQTKGLLGCAPNPWPHP